MDNIIGVVTALLGILMLCAAWVTHIVWWVTLVMTEQMDTIGEAVLAILGTLVAPVGIVHGFILWFS